MYIEMLIPTIANKKGHIQLINPELPALLYKVSLKSSI